MKMSELSSIKMTSWLVIMAISIQLGCVISHERTDMDEMGDHEFNYDPQSPFGVNNWANLYPQCGIKNMSPVNIDTGKVRFAVKLRCPRISYRKILAGTLRNNGHTTTFTTHEHEAVKMTNVPYSKGTYIIREFHIHWGGVKTMMNGRFSGRLSEGSEHVVNNRSFSGEIHFVFYNSRYTGLEEAFGVPGGVTVVARFVQRVQPGQRLSREAVHLSKFLEWNIPAVFDIDSSFRTKIDFSLFVDHKFHFYTYLGSTTTPVCHQNVRFVILREPISVTDEAWNVFRGVDLNEDFSGRYGNNRPVQPLDGRIIEANFKSGHHSNN